MKNYIIKLFLCILIFTSCVENPNVTEDVYMENPNASKSWVVGLKRQLAITTNAVNVNVEITSDNYFNNYTQYSKVFDVLNITYIDTDVNRLQASILQLREMADYGIEKIIPGDHSTTSDDIAYMYFCLGYAHLLGGELFTGLPESSLGAVQSPEESFHLAINALDLAYEFESSADRQSAYDLLKARAYYNLEDISNAVTFAVKSLAQPQLVLQVEFDGQNGVPNEMQNATYDALPNRLAPLPRLDFLDPKYYSVGTPSADQKPVAIVKSEEAYLILAQANLASNNINSAKQNLRDLLQLVAIRPVAKVNDITETRNGGNRSDYPLSKVDVKFDANDDFRPGFILDRTEEPINVHTISGTNVTVADINSASSIDEVLYLVYRLRQEIFMSEGRRLADLGVKYPISEIEKDNNANISDEYLITQMPDFVKNSGGLDDFKIDDAGNVIMTVDMNKVIVQNKNSKLIVPFF